MKKKMLLVAGVIAAAAITSVSFAAGSQGTADISITAGGSSTIATVTQAASTTDGKYGQNPKWAPVANTVGSVTAGDLYKISTPTPGNILVTLYLTNAAALSSAYSYLNLKVNVYSYAGSSWSTISNVDPEFLSFNNGYVTFEIPAQASGIYGISVDEGSYYCTTTSTSADLSPSFYLTVQPTA